MMINTPAKRKQKSSVYLDENAAAFKGTARILSIVSTIDNQFVVTLDQPVTIGSVAQDDPAILIGGTTANGVTQTGPDSFMIDIVVLGGTGYWWAVTGQPGWLLSPMLIVPQVGSTS